MTSPGGSSARDVYRAYLASNRSLSRPSWRLSGVYLVPIVVTENLSNTLTSGCLDGLK